jgi:CRISPR-associated protein Csm5
MNDFLLPMVLQVKVLTPVHVGTGEKLSFKSFVVDGDEVTTIDEDRLIAWTGADRRRSDAFVAFAENRDEHINDFLARLGKDPGEFAAYRIRRACPGLPRDILSFIKTVGHSPYLPGSSFKGSLRSSLMRGWLLEKPERADQMAKVAERVVSKGANDPGHELEAQVFTPAKKEPAERGQRPNFDVIRAIGVGDSNLLAPSDLHVVEVRVLSHQRDSTLRFKSTQRGPSDRPMQIYAEMLQPGTILRLPVSVNRALMLGQGAANQLGFEARGSLIARFYRYCRVASTNLLEQELAFYEGHRQQQLAEAVARLLDQLKALPDSAFYLPLGWGTGFDAKTVTDLLGKEVFRMVVTNQKYKNMRRLGRPGGSDEWLGPELSPKTRKVVYYSEEGLEPIGWLRVELYSRK